MNSPLPQSFFDRHTLIVAQELLGKFLVRQLEGEQLAFMITEVEAYDGFEDKASHAYRGPTPRNQVMFGPAGVWYVYLVYGMHWMLNIVTGSVDYPAAILIRGAGAYNGPGKLAKALHIDKQFQGRPATVASGLWIEDRGMKPKGRIQKAARIGVDYAGKVWAKKPYRFLMKESASV